MAFSPTPEQLAIVEAASTTQDNLIIKALAGAAKTSTLVLMAEALRKTPILCLAFNKKIAEEMKTRLPDNCVSMTLNGLGHRTWSEFLRKRLTVETKKNYLIVKEFLEAWKPKQDRDYLFANMAAIIEWVSIAKRFGWIPEGTFPYAKSMYENDASFFASLEEIPNPLEEKLLRKVVIESISQALSGYIDFDDQIMMPTLFPCHFPQYPLVMIDESQDLSELNHATLAKLLQSGNRLIAVGDPCQAIYAFRGASETSMDQLEKTFNMRSLYLSVSFRCPRAVVREAQWRAPTMKWPEWAKDGEVSTLDDWGIETVPDNGVIICRNNAPLFSCAIRFFANGRYAEIAGNDIGKRLIKILKKFGPTSLPQKEVLEQIAEYELMRASKLRTPGRAADEAECLRIFARQGENLGAIIAYAEHICVMSGRVKLMTGHKSKGLEFEDVFILDRHLLKITPGHQDCNLLYVMQTRSQNRLTYINLEDFVTTEEKRNEMV